MIDIDGSHGEGGGQIIRSSLALAALTGQTVRFRNVRAKRSRPGLQRQHLTAVRAAAEISAAELDGAELHSREFTFTPHAIEPGEHRFSIGTAGSTTLVVQTVLPMLLTAAGPSSLMLEGGTHNPHAPPFDFLARSFLPLINRMGPRVEAALDRPGFYPAGGGRFEVRIEPVSEPGRAAPVRAD
ncbi:MAG: RNA 3'-terminal phosphate cyclase, partial [Planctomycetaceae bacterium]